MYVYIYIYLGMVTPILTNIPVTSRREVGMIRPDSNVNICFFLRKKKQHSQYIPSNVSPGLINLKRLFNWEGTIKKKYQIMIIGGVPPQKKNKQWFINPGLTLYP